jgi:hypothetical protein
VGVADPLESTGDTPLEYKDCLKTHSGQVTWPQLPDKVVTSTFMRRALDVVEKQAGNALGIVLTAYVRWQMQQMGLPPQ